ncbi:DoxX family protein [Ferrovibrio sp.]|uniref:DoxX family protein n=1 Tax=Ferrovibrio sp. TaxID=1917215 RepID=UPI003514A675
MSRQGSIATAWAGLTGTLELFPMAVIQLMLRIGVAMVFWKSGLTKVVTTESGSWPLLPPELGSSTVMLFELEYQVPLLPPELAAWLATAAELTMPVLLVLGLGSRFAAAALLGMTAVIQVFVYPGNWPEHLFWAGALALILTRGAGAISLDALIAGRR